MAKPGRKRKSGISRQKNGQPSRVGLNEYVKATVIGARVRLYGLSPQDADTELAGYAIGRMALAGDFGREYQPAIDAVRNYVEAVAEYMRIKHPMMPMPKAMDYLAGKGSSLRPEPSLKTVSKIERRYAEVIEKLAAAQGADRVYFHEAAFHDRIGGTNAIHAVIRCVGILLRA